jgi:hypothetical protein
LAGDGSGAVNAGSGFVTGQNNAVWPALSAIGGDSVGRSAGLGVELDTAGLPGALAHPVASKEPIRTIAVIDRRRCGFAIFGGTGTPMTADGFR